MKAGEGYAARLKELLDPLFAESSGEIARNLWRRVERYRSELIAEARPGAQNVAVGQRDLDQGDLMLISYGDSLREEGRAPLAALKAFLDDYAREIVTALHILPMFPSTSDDGFSVVDYRLIDPVLGGWEEIADLARGYALMFDAVVNHVSRSSPWFQSFLRGDADHDNWFIRSREGEDCAKVIRPRALPLFTPFETSRGLEKIWTTFSEDQVDLNFAEPGVLLEIVDTLLFYSARGASFIRLDAIGFAWKEAGTTCLNLPGAHAIVKIARAALDALGAGTRIVTETNVPHLENIAYFGRGDEARLVYQFPLPPLVLHAFLRADAETLSRWAAGLSAMALPPGCAYFNFLASHDGIGLRPTEEILDEGERDFLVQRTLERGGRVGFREGGGGKKVPYELNINYLDALSAPEAGEDERVAKFLAAHALLFALDGLPGLYIHSLVGSRNWVEGVLESGINRRINREKLELGELRRELEAGKGLRARIFEGIKALARTRRAIPALAPGCAQRVLSLDPRVFALSRSDEGSSLLVLINVSGDGLGLPLEGGGFDSLSGERLVPPRVELGPWQPRWILMDRP